MPVLISRYQASPKHICIPVVGQGVELLDVACRGEATNDRFAAATFWKNRNNALPRSCGRDIVMIAP
jgi:hypothetical protein